MSKQINHRRIGRGGYRQGKGKGGRGKDVRVPNIDWLINNDRIN